MVRGVRVVLGALFFCGGALLTATAGTTVTSGGHHHGHHHRHHGGDRHPHHRRHGGRHRVRKPKYGAWKSSPQEKKEEAPVPSGLVDPRAKPSESVRAMTDRFYAKTKEGQHSKKDARKLRRKVEARRKSRARKATRKILDHFKRKLIHGEASQMRLYETDAPASKHHHRHRRHRRHNSAPCSMKAANASRPAARRGAFLAPTGPATTAMLSLEEVERREDPLDAYRGLHYCRQCLCDVGVAVHANCVFELERLSWDKLPLGKLDYLAKCIEDVPGCDCKACNDRWAEEDYPRKESLKCSAACKKAGAEEIEDGEEPPPPCTQDEAEDMHKPPNPLDVWKVHLGHNVAVKFAEEDCKPDDNPKEMEAWLMNKMSCLMAALGPARAYYCACEEGDDEGCSEKDGATGKEVLSFWHDNGAPSPEDMVAGIAPKGAGWYCSPEFGVMGHDLFVDLDPLLEEVVPPMIEKFALEMLEEMEGMGEAEANEFAEGLTPTELEQLALEDFKEHEGEAEGMAAGMDSELEALREEMAAGLVDEEKLNELKDDAEDLGDNASLDDDKEVIAEMRDVVDSMESAATDNKLEEAEKSLDRAAESLKQADEVIGKLEEGQEPPDIHKEVEVVVKDLEEVDANSKKELAQEEAPKLAEDYAKEMTETFDTLPKDGKLNDVEFEAAKEFVEEHDGGATEELGESFAPVVVDADKDGLVEEKELKEALEPAVKKALEKEDE